MSRDSRINLTGKRFGWLLVLEYAYTKVYSGKHYKAYWKCRCDCGVHKNINAQSLMHGYSKSCGCRQHEAQKLQKGEAAFNCLYTDYKTGAVKRGYEFLLSKDDFRVITKQDCFYCGTKPEQTSGTKRCNGSYVYNGIDRVDNNGGYVLNNCVACCSVCNYAKRDMSLENFIEHIKKICLHMEIDC